MGEHTPLPWQWSKFNRHDGKPIRTVQDVADTTAHSALLGDLAELHGVTEDTPDEDGFYRVICYTGNGPHSERNAEMIARAVNLYAELLAVAKELEESAAYWSEYDVPTGIVDRLRAAIAKAEPPDADTDGWQMWADGKMPCGECGGTGWV